MLGVVSNDWIAGCVVGAASLPGSESWQEVVSPGFSAVAGCGPADVGCTAVRDASSLKCGDQSGTVRDHVRFDYGGVLAGSQSVRVRTDLMRFEPTGSWGVDGVDGVVAA